jgi:N-acetyl-1-D-myo-inositol-2-amino-2-deoxy-alpha-D-glucopyranoside deacetylase
LLFVHAHPDDESITNGATMARYVAEGAQVTLITCTRGEQGEVIPASLTGLTTGVHGTLGPHRERELAAAMKALGVTDHRYLGDPSGTRFVDSGMALDHEGVVIPSPDPPKGAFAVADAEAEAKVLAEVLRSVRPQVVVTYEPGGGYGHPDHVRAHVITMRAVELATVAGPRGEPAWRVPKVYWIVIPQSLVRAALKEMALAADRPSDLDPDGRLPSMMVPDQQVTTAIDATAYTAAKVAALRAHETQVSVADDDAFFALSNGFFQPIMGMEFFRLVRGDAAGPFDDLGRETDLFAGVD